VATPSDTLLIIDDADETRYTLARYLRRDGFEVLEAANGETGLVLADHEKPALIILDVKLPGVSGFEVTQKLRANPETARIPVLQISASFTGSADIVHGLDGGADGYMILPVDPEELVATVRALLRLSRAEATARKLAAQWQATFDAIMHAVCVVDARGAVESYNQGFVSFVGVSEALLKGRPFAECLATAGVHDPALLQAPSVSRVTTKRIEVGANVFQISISPLAPASEGSRGGAICVFWDVTPHMAHERRLTRENEELREELRRKTEALDAALNARQTGR
jgi:CheY-like chemotaxis protein